MKISKIEYGLGGYQDVEMGLSITFEGSGYGVGHFEKPSGPEIKKYLEDAKVKSLDKLKNIPCEVSFEGNCFRSWRVLTEVI